MNIEYVSNDSRVQIKTLNPGEVFIDGGGSPMMCIEEIVTNDGDYYNAVSLDDGLLYDYDETTYVIKKPSAILKI